MFKHILIPLDGSSYAEKALPYAEGLARATGAELELITIIPRLPSHLRDVRSMERASKNLALEYLAPVQRRLEEEGITARSVVIFGNPAEGIVNYAKEQGVDLILMSTHGIGSGGQYALGSIALKVLQVAPCPVCLVRIDVQVGREETPASEKDIEEEV